MCWVSASLDLVKRKKHCLEWKGSTSTRCYCLSVYRYTSHRCLTSVFFPRNPTNMHTQNYHPAVLYYSQRFFICFSVIASRIKVIWTLAVNDTSSVLTARTNSWPRLVERVIYLVQYRLSEHDMYIQMSIEHMVVSFHMWTWTT